MRLRNLSLVAPGPIERQAEFNSGTGCVADLYLACLGRFETDAIGKVHIELLAQEQAEQIEQGLNVLIVRQSFDFAAYFSTDKFARKAMALAEIHRAMSLAAETRGWSADRIEAARDCVLERNIENIQLWPKPLPRPSTTRHKAQVRIHFDTDRIEGMALLLEPKGEVAETVNLFSLPPLAFLLYDALGRFEWVDEDTVQLEARSGRKKWVASFSPQ
jgi:hypothetical protein